MQEQVQLQLLRPKHRHRHLQYLQHLGPHLTLYWDLQTSHPHHHLFEMV